LFERAGEGKSTLANMLIQDDIGPDNIFPIGDSAVGETSEVVYAFNDYFEPTFNYICYVKKGSRIAKEGKNTFNEFKKIFEGSESNFAIIITVIDFPYNDRYNIEVLKRMRIEKVLEVSVKFESKVSEVAGFIPIIGTAYNLITS
ncbi:22399_t:CDS:2, partial [Gigaspora rosea]